MSTARRIVRIEEALLQSKSARGAKNQAKKLRYASPICLVKVIKDSTIFKTRLGCRGLVVLSSAQAEQHDSGLMIAINNFRSQVFSVFSKSTHLRFFLLRHLTVYKATPLTPHIYHNLSFFGAAATAPENCSSESSFSSANLRTTLDVAVAIFDSLTGSDRWWHQLAPGPTNIQNQR